MDGQRLVVIAAATTMASFNRFCCWLTASKLGSQGLSSYCSKNPPTASMSKPASVAECVHLRIPISLWYTSWHHAISSKLSQILHLLTWFTEHVEVHPIVCYMPNICYVCAIKTKHGSTPLPTFWHSSVSHQLYKHVWCWNNQLLSWHQQISWHLTNFFAILVQKRCSKASWIILKGLILAPCN